ncbi:hypothetical protein C0992_001398 [Termitomyces sp. T32_za158]|nr:hypothetical protein C0992_001398 [Termitomyces sp. T32_za158]
MSTASADVQPNGHAAQHNGHAVQPNGRTGITRSGAPSRVTLSLGHLPSKTDIKAPWPRTPTRVDPNNPPWPAYRGYHEYSFAHATMQSRLPTILGKAIEDATRTLNEESSEERIVDLVACIERMGELMTDLSGNAKLRPIVDDNEADVALWNKEIAKYFQGIAAIPSFMYTWRYVILRKGLHERTLVCDTFSRSADAVFELSMRFAEPFKLSEALSPEERLEAERLMFLELTQEEQIKSLQSTGGDHLAATEKNILGNHLNRLWETVKELREKTGGRIDFVLDNAGFELGLATQIRFHGKRYPWFVSDVTKKDWEWLLNTMCYGQLFPKATDPELESLRRLGQRWKQYEKEGKWVYEQHPFWCTGYTFWEMHGEAPDLFLHLSRSDLVYFKGDLNHRKLTYDCAAPASTPFEIAIGPMASSAGAPKIASLRTIKSDVVVGLGDQGDLTAENLDKVEPGWKISGKYAVVLFSEGRPGEKVRFA